MASEPGSKSPEISAGRSVGTAPKLCKSCGSNKHGQFRSEVAIHFAGLKGVDIPVAWVFPEVSVCLNCGVAEFVVPDNQLFLLTLGNALIRD